MEQKQFSQNEDLSDIIDKMKFLVDELDIKIRLRLNNTS